MDAGRAQVRMESPAPALSVAKLRYSAAASVGMQPAMTAPAVEPGPHEWISRGLLGITADTHATSNRRTRAWPGMAMCRAGRSTLQAVGTRNFDRPGCMRLGAPILHSAQSGALSAAHSASARGPGLLFLFCSGSPAAAPLSSKP